METKGNQLFEKLMKHFGHKVAIEIEPKNEEKVSCNRAVVVCKDCQEELHSVSIELAPPFRLEYDWLVHHKDHTLEVGGYKCGNEIFNVAVECMDCCEVLVDADKYADEEDEPEITIEGSEYCQRGRVRVEWEALGESLFGGEFDDEDLDDVEVLRFYVLWLNDEDEWEEVNDGSYCTRMPWDAGDTILQAGLKRIMEGVYSQLMAGQSVKKTCEELSWIAPDWLKLIDGKGGEAA